MAYTKWEKYSTMYLLALNMFIVEVYMWASEIDRILIKWLNIRIIGDLTSLPAYNNNKRSAKEESWKKETKNTTTEQLRMMFT